MLESMHIVNTLQLKLGPGLNISISIYLLIFLNFIIWSCFDMDIKLSNKMLYIYVYMKQNCCSLPTVRKPPGEVLICLSGLLASVRTNMIVGHDC